MAGLNVQLKEALNDHLVSLRTYLLATPPPAQPAKPMWTSAVPTDAAMPPPQPPKPRWVSAVPADSEMTNGSVDPMLKRLDELIRTLNEASALTEGVNTVERLALQMRKCQAIVLDMESRFKFNTIKLPRGKLKSVDFGNIRGCVQLTSRYYDQLEFYKTDEGKKFLRGAASTKLNLDREGDVAVRHHHLDEQIDPLASVRKWDYAKVYLPWAEKQIAKNADPIDHIVEFLIDKTNENRPFMDDALYNLFPVETARLHATERVGDSLTVKVRTHVPGDEKFPLPGGAPRMWIYQVKVPTKDLTGQAEFELGSWQWTCEVWSDNAASLPILRVVHTAARSGNRRDITNDFTRGTLYAMRGPSTMRCYPAYKFHSALFDAEVTSAAGILVANEGRVAAIDNRSGHYQPGFRQLQTAVQFLQSNLLFEHDAFVAVHVCNSDPRTQIGAEALYFSPADFLVAAQSGMSFGVVAACLARMAQQYGHGLPVPARHANLIPPVLSDFSNGRNRWDRMLATYYGGKRGLETIVADLKAILKPPGAPKWVIGRRDGTPGSKTARRESDHVALAAQTLQAIESGGVYCNLPELLRKLLAATRASSGPIGEAKDQISLIQASQRYGDIAKRLADLKPERGHF
jgi:hypothetical protein